MKVWGVSNENMEVSNEHMGSPMKIYKIFPRFQIVDKINPRKGLCPVRAVTLSTLRIFVLLLAKNC